MDDRLTMLERERYISLTTYRRDGRAVATPVWFAIDGARILVWTDIASGKAKRVRATGRVSVAPSSARGAPKGAAVDGQARVLPAEDFEASNKFLTAKYRWLKPLVDLWTSVSYTVRRKPHPVEVYIEVLLTPAAEGPAQ